MMWEEFSLLLMWMKPEPEMLFTVGDKMKILDVAGSDRRDSSCRPGRRLKCHRKFQLDENLVFFSFDTLLSRDALVYSKY